MTARRFGLILLFLFASLTLQAQPTVTVQSTPNPALLGAPVVITATVTPATATGRITFYDGVTVLGTKSLTSGATSLSTIALPAGVRKLRAYYAGDSSNAAASSAIISQTVNAQPAASLSAGGRFSVQTVNMSSYAVADFNGDGKADIAYTSNGTLSVQLGDGAGNFQESFTANAGGRSAAVADFNGDGVQDLALANFFGGLLVFLGNGNGTFQAPLNIVASNALTLAVGDFNGDGKADLVAGGFSNRAEVLLGKGDGTFQPAVPYATYTQQDASVVSVLVADMNADGKADLVVGQNYPIVSVLLGNGDGTFQAAVNSTTHGNFFIAAADLNADGKVDIAGIGDAGVTIILGKGDGTFQPEVNYAPSVTGNASVTVADFNGDGKSDLALGGIGAVNVLLGNGDGTFQAPTAYPALPGNPMLVPSDFNGDGRTDLFAFGQFTAQVFLGTTSTLTATAGTSQSSLIGAPFTVPLQVTIKNGGTPVSGITVTFTVPPSAGPTAVLSSSTAVTDNNGVASVSATAGGNTGSYTVTATALGLSASFKLTNLATPASIITASPTERQAALFGTAFSKPLQVTITDSDHVPAAGITVTFTSPGSGPSAALSATSAVTNASGVASITATANNVAGSYNVTATAGQLLATFPLTNLQPLSVTLTTNANPSNLSSPLAITATVASTGGAGRVTFFDDTTIIGVRTAVAGVATLSTTILPAGVHKLKAYYRDDLNFIAGTSNVVVQTVKALPGGLFTTLNPIVLNPPPYAAVVGDFNGDGKADLAFPRFVTGLGAVVTVLIGKGDGSFQAPADYLVGANSVYYLAISDFNGDGKPDIAVTTLTTGQNTTTNSVSILLGRGDGTFGSAVAFAAVSSDVGPILANSLAVGDFNGDGKADVAYGYVTQVTVPEGPMVYPVRINLLFGNGDGTLTAPVAYTGLSSNNGQSIVRLLTGDFNNDGKADLVVSSGSAGTVVFLGNGDGTVQSSAAVNLPSPGFTTLASGDFNGDGKLDLIVDNKILLGKGDGTFLSPTNTTTGPVVANGDFNGDGILDLVAPDAGLTTTTVLLGNGNGTFQQGPTVTGGVPLGVADFNGDGRSDIIAVNGTAVTVFLGAATGSTPSGTPAGLEQVGLNVHTTSVGVAFDHPLQVLVTDSNHNPVSGVVVTFTPPATGASAILSALSAVTDGAGIAYVTATANNIPGSYNVIASVNNLSIGIGLTQIVLYPIDLAIGATATQSSTLPGYPKAVASSAIDTNPDGNFFSGSVTHTNLEANPWWQADLQTSQAIGQVVVWNRTDCCSDRLTDYWVFISDVPFGPGDTPATLANRAGTFSYHQTVAPNPSTTILTDGARGRYLRVQLSGTNNLSLAEVQVFAPSTIPTNLALNRTATQSGNYFPTSDASRAVDGNTDGSFYDGSVSHTGFVPNAWWQVDLGTPAIINSVMIWNRTDCCGDRLSDYWVFVSNDPFLSTDTPATLQTRANTYGVHQTTAPNPTALVAIGVQGRYVRIQLSTANLVPLHMAEVQVLGTGGAPSSTNLAVNKPASQSSTLSGYSTAVAGSAVDGNTDGNFFDGSVSHTDLEANPWWQVDLGASASITSVTVWNRTDQCCLSRLLNFWIFISDTPFLPTDTPATLRNRAGTVSSFLNLVPLPRTTVQIAAQGRYVRIQLDNGGYLNLAEVQIFGSEGTSTVTNVAAGKSASQSSTLAGYSTTGAEKAVDGNTNGGFFNGSVTHTNPEANAWWQVDLGTTPTISSVVVWNRTDCCSERLNDYWVFVSNTPFAATDTPATLQGRAGTFASHQTVAPSPSTTINLSQPGRYVRVQLSGVNPLSLAEVQVFGQ